jgi:hypothetical protein
MIRCLLCVHGSSPASEHERTAHSARFCHQDTSDKRLAQTAAIDDWLKFHTTDPVTMKAQRCVYCRWEVL